MNKVININLGGYPFTIDDDAFKHLDKYLSTIRRHFSKSEGFEEIISDIESRMAELFAEQMGTRKIVTIEDVKEAISIMGTPEDFGTDSLEEEPMASGAGSTSGREGKYKTGKRLFRNSEDNVIAGVCSGLAAYFGISDPLWVRILFILLTLSTGFPVLAYIILWAITPEAETAGDRLAMRGEPINVSNIGKIIEEEVDHISKKVSEFGEDIEHKFSSKKKVLEEPIEPIAPFRLETPLRKGLLS